MLKPVPRTPRDGWEPHSGRKRVIATIRYYPTRVELAFQDTQGWIVLDQLRPVDKTWLIKNYERLIQAWLRTASFSYRLWISTPNKWGPNAEVTIHNQQPPVHRVALSDLGASPVDWDALEKGVHGDKARHAREHLRPHQTAAFGVSDWVRKGTSRQHSRQSSP